MSHGRWARSRKSLVSGRQPKGLVTRPLTEDVAAGVRYAASELDGAARTRVMLVTSIQRRKVIDVADAVVESHLLLLPQASPTAVDDVDTAFHVARRPSAASGLHPSPKATWMPQSAPIRPTMRADKSASKRSQPSPNHTVGEAIVAFFSNLGEGLPRLRNALALPRWRSREPMREGA